MDGRWRPALAVYALGWLLLASGSARVGMARLTVAVEDVERIYRHGEVCQENRCLAEELSWRRAFSRWFAWSALPLHRGV